MEQIGRYRILDELGRGATGVVYRAQDPAIGRIIAIKTIRLSDFTDQEERERLRERLFREAQSAGILSHPNIVTIYDVAEENGLAYIFMEYVEGAPLDKVLNAERALAPSVVLSVFRQTAAALDYAHKKGIVHRDIKPANILIHDGNIAKITDFGVAKILSQQMTQHGVMMGTPNYMSPEQVQGHSVDGRADQFSLAVIAYEVLTGEKPFVADHLPTLLFRIVREDPLPAQRFNPTLGPQVEMVLKKALSKNASERYLTTVDFVEALATACSLNPGWHPLPRSMSQTLPTIGAGAAIEHTAARVPAGETPPAPPQPLPAPRLLAREEEESSNPLLRSLVWMLVGIGLVGLVLFGAQKFLFNRNTESPAEAPVQTATAKPGGPSPQSTAKPSPVGDSADKPPAEADPNSPAKSNAAPRQTASQTDESHPSIPSGEVAPKSGSERTVQFLTDPPGADITIDGDSSHTCKTPCLLPLDPGRHALNAHLDGYRPYPRVFKVPEDSDIFLQLNKTAGTLSVTSTPSGASIEINGQMQAKSTPTVFNLPPGTYHVRVARNGAFLEFDVQLKDGEFLSKGVSF